MGVGCGECDFSPLIILNRFTFFALGVVGGALSRVVGALSRVVATFSWLRGRFIYNQVLPPQGPLRLNSSKGALFSVRLIAMSGRRQGFLIFIGAMSSNLVGQCLC